MRYISVSYKPSKTITRLEINVLSLIYIYTYIYIYIYIYIYMYIMILGKIIKIKRAGQKSKRCKTIK